MSDPRVSLLLALADDELILGHRLSEWTGWVPYVEEDLALSSIAQDEMAHARTMYQIIETIDGRDVDTLALGRAPEEYRNAILCERPSRDFAGTIARCWLYDIADDVRLASLEGCSFKELREAIGVMRLEERYHLEHGALWFTRLASGPVEARHRLGEALSELYQQARAVFEPVQNEDALTADGTMPESSETLEQRWVARIGDELAAVGLEHVISARIEAESGEMIPTSSGALPTPEAGTAPAGEARTTDGLGGRRGQHSEDFLPMWQEMTALYRAHPGARW
jgi:ring-1,2-phenylacetyl-CoA epoxidase subunit PaaC